MKTDKLPLMLMHLLKCTDSSKLLKQIYKPLLLKFIHWFIGTKALGPGE